jgi:sugar phosphate isomerase/epimerase
VHPQLSLSAVSSWRLPFGADRALWDDLGVARVGLSLRKCEERGLARAAADLAADGRDVTNIVEAGWLDLHVPDAWRATTDRWRAAIDALAGCAPWVFVLTAGTAHRLAWDEAAARFARAIAPVCADARDAGVTIAVENTSSLRVDLSLVHRLADALDLAAVAGVSVCAELQSCWAERGVGRLLTDPRVVHVQVSDYAVGSLTTPDRVVPGDGDVALTRLFGALARGGYRGAYELELVGPRIEAEGYRSAIARSIAWLEANLPPPPPHAAPSPPQPA